MSAAYRATFRGSGRGSAVVVDRSVRGRGLPRPPGRNLRSCCTPRTDPEDDPSRWPLEPTKHRRTTWTLKLERGIEHCVDGPAGP